MVRPATYLLASFLVLAAACGSVSEGGKHPASSSTTGSTGTGAAGGGGSGAGASGGGGAAGGGGEAGGSIDAGTTPDGGAEAGNDCSVDGNPGTCIEVSACADMEGYSSTPGYCPGPDDIQCCAPTPDVADNPPVPPGWELMEQSEVTPAMTAWAVMILDDPTDYPMFSTAEMTFGTLLVLARVEWHPPDFQNDVVHRGVTLYQQI